MRAARTSLVSAKAPAAAPARVGMTYSGVASGLVRAAARPMLANTASPARPRPSRRTASIPITAANTASTIRMPVSSAVLSSAPNVEMAKSLTAGGVRSMDAWPTAITGELSGLVSPANSWPMPIATAAVSTPATAPASALGCRYWSLGADAGVMTGLAGRRWLPRYPPRCLRPPRKCCRLITTAVPVS